MGTMTYTGTLAIETCCNCDITFAMPEDFQQRALDRPRSMTFYCPAGHAQHYTGESPVKREERLRRDAEARALATRDQLDAEKRSHAATKGARTKLRRRIAAGVCPCCNRTFQNVHRHIASQHPEFEA